MESQASFQIVIYEILFKLLSLGITQALKGSLKINSMLV